MEVAAMVTVEEEMDHLTTKMEGVMEIAETHKAKVWLVLTCQYLRTGLEETPIITRTAF